MKMLKILKLFDDDFFSYVTTESHHHLCGPFIVHLVDGVMKKMSFKYLFKISNFPLIVRIARLIEQQKAKKNQEILV